MSVRIEIKVIETVPAVLDRYGKTETAESVRIERYEIDAVSVSAAVEKAAKILAIV